MKIMLVTTPIRPIPTNYPPFGLLGIAKYLKKNGYSDVEFYNIDGNRPGYDAVLAHIEATKPDILGISAVVSTAYAYTKRLSLDVKARLPDTLIVAGGNLVASAEILLRRTGVDICVLGEGERVFLNVVRQREQSRSPADFSQIRGLMLLTPDGLVNTGYEVQLDKTEIYDIDWDDLFSVSPIDHFIFDPLADPAAGSMIDRDSRAQEPHRRGKTVVQLHGSKGCVAKCTFCHRWDKGIRYIPVDLLMERIEELIRRFNMGFLILTDENFGTDRRWLQEFCEKIKRYDLLWRVGGMRVNCISPDAIDMMKGAGCVCIIYGMETGSEKMLQVMEKKVKLQDNYKAMEWTIGAGLYTIIQLVIGMPGETLETIRETIEFCKYGLTLRPEQNPNNLSINYAQALPGTPLYEFARHKGLIGKDIDGEEAYLLRISDTDAHDEVATLNFTDYPTLVCQTWRPLIQTEVNYAYVRKFGVGHYRRVLLADANYFERERPDTGYFANPKRLVDMSLTSDTVHDMREVHVLEDDEGVPSLWSLLRSGRFGLALICYPVLAYHLRHLMLLIVLFKDWRRNGIRYACRIVAEYVTATLRTNRRKLMRDHESLRRIVGKDLGVIPGDSLNMQPLRKGR